jgi:hypothetical protein
LIRAIIIEPVRRDYDIRRTSQANNERAKCKRSAGCCLESNLDRFGVDAQMTRCVLERAVSAAAALKMKTFEDGGS